MPAEYINITEEQLLGLQESLSLLEGLSVDIQKNMDLFLYGLTTNEAILDAAREAIAGYSDVEMTEEDVQLSEIAVAIPISSDTLHYLLGSGLKLWQESFAFASQDEGPRQVSFSFGNFRPTCALIDLQKTSLAETDGGLAEFYQKNSGGVPAAQIQKKVRRTEEATQPNVPTPTTEQPQAPAAPAATPQPKRTSVDMARLIENFLG